MNAPVSYPTARLEALTADRGELDRRCGVAVDRMRSGKETMVSMPLNATCGSGGGWDYRPTKVVRAGTLETECLLLQQPALRGSYAD